MVSLLLTAPYSLSPRLYEGIVTFADLGYQNMKDFEQHDLENRVTAIERKESVSSQV